jgi:hypothetical protein
MYSFRDLIAIRVANHLRGQGIDVRSLRRVVAYLRKHKGLSLSPSDVLATTYLVSDGRDLYEVAGDVMLSTLRKPGQRGFLIVALDELVNEVQQKLRSLNASLGEIAAQRAVPAKSVSKASPKESGARGARQALASD